MFGWILLSRIKMPVQAIDIIGACCSANIRPLHTVQFPITPEYKIVSSERGLL
jgi:hypothetical protein